MAEQNSYNLKVITVHTPSKHIMESKVHYTIFYCFPLLLYINVINCGLTAPPISDLVLWSSVRVPPNCSITVSEFGGRLWLALLMIAGGDVKKKQQKTYYIIKLTED